MTLSIHASTIDRARSEWIGPGIPIDELHALSELDSCTIDELGTIEPSFQLTHTGHAEECRLPAPPRAERAQQSTESSLSKLRAILSSQTYAQEPNAETKLQALSRLALVLEAHLMLVQQAKQGDE